MIVVSGNTFEHRNTIKGYGARWDGNRKVWLINDKVDVSKLRQIPGIVVTSDDTEPTPDDHIAPVAPAAEPVKPVRVEKYTTIYGDDETHYGAFDTSDDADAFYGFSSLSEMIKFIDVLPWNSWTGGRRSAWRVDGDHARWTGTDSLPHAIRLAHDWQEGVEQAERIRDMIEADQPLRERLANSIVGGNVNVGRLLAGNPVHMKRRAKRPGPKIVTLYCNVGALADVKPRAMIARAAACAAIVDILENNDYACEIIAVWDSSDGKHRAQCCTNVKQAGETLNLNDVVFSLGHPSFLRRLVFAVTSAHTDMGSAWFSGRGASNNVRPHDETALTIKRMQAHVDYTNTQSLINFVLPKNFPVKLKGAA